MSYHGYPMVKSTFYTDRTSNPTPPSIGLESGAKLVERLLYGLNSKYDPFTIRVSPEREREREREWKPACIKTSPPRM